ncbi:penicillin-binding protein activator [Acinetobacter lwoffii]|uniref:penicillin-binding protein activator n=1 Tax=Acinetobacter lwoffii TaxID=28090 RepID=UPI0021CDCBF3|nr:penicillin-binding protein activator [Acinetobacter lwoffii]MCU4439110.1 penicillin-binding protein activator [Acinetobacter lwoffii]
MWNKLNNKKWKIKNKILGLCLVSYISSVQAEVLIILPESGPLARAASSIKQGFLSAYATSAQKVPLKWVNSNQKNISQLLKQHVNKKTQMVVGPLARSDVEQLLKSKPKVRTLSLNDVAESSPQVWQFSLSKKEDAAALKTLLVKDGVQQLLVLRQPGSEAEHELLLMSLLSQSDLNFKIVNKAPIFLMPRQGLLFLGNAEGLAAIPELSRKRMYTVANAISAQHRLPQGIKFCDVPVLYLADWPDVVQAYAQEPVNMSYQRLIAFGGDAWQITQQYLSQPRSQNVEFQGRTGRIQITEHGIQRSPQCFQYSGTGVKLL